MHILKKNKDDKIPRNSLNGKSRFERRAKKLFTLFSCLIAALAVTTVPALAADAADPLAVVNNLSEFSAPVSGR